jgi:4'-phosphopantetheinyl transferase
MSVFAPRAPVGLVLPAGEIQLWSVALDPAPEVVERLGACLADEEWERARRFRFDQHRRQFVVGRGALRWLLAAYLGIAPEAVRFTYGPRGKPFLAPPQNGTGAAELFFNLSNSHELALVGFLRGLEIGVDVEHQKPMADLVQISERFFSLSERQALLGLAEELRPQGFFNCWTRKEAYLKAVGEGLAAALDSFDVTLRPGEAPRMLTLRGDAARAARWTFAAFDPAAGYVGAIAVEAGEMPVRTFRFTL